MSTSDKDHEFTGGDDSYCVLCGEPDQRVVCWVEHGSSCHRRCTNDPCDGMISEEALMGKLYGSELLVDGTEDDEDTDE